MTARLAYALGGTLLAFAFTPSAAPASECAPKPAYDLEVSSLINATRGPTGSGATDRASAQSGHHALNVYNQVASDGGERWGSYFAKASYRNGPYAFTIETHFSSYDTQHAGADTYTVVHTIAGPTIAVPWFVATERTSEARVERCIRFLQLYAGIGYLQTNSNYRYPIGYDPIYGAGVGLERYADPARRFDVFAALFFYPNAAAAYGNRTLTFQDTTFDGGFRWRPWKSPFAILAGLYQELRVSPGLRVAQTIRAAPYVGIGFSR